MSAEPSNTSDAPVREGDVLASKYRVEKVLGVGGMGVVVAATHMELRERVALKFLRPAATGHEELVERFLREARASVKLKGEHVVKTLDVGRLDDGAPYIVMEYLQGHDLGVELRAASGPVAIEDAATYLLHACEGLAEAHALGIIHRDLKPGNLFLTRGVDGKPLVKVLDFGISKTIDSSAAREGLSLTKTEMLLGSPLYMSPEQMRSSKNVDERSDIWSLGAILYELVTGKVPFSADSIMDLCFKVVQETARPMRELREGVSEELDRIVERCMAKNGEDRYANVAELAAAVEPFASPREQGTAARVLDMLGAGTRAPKHSLHVKAGPSPATATPVPIAIGSAPADSAWGATQAEPLPAKKGKGALTVGVGIAFAAVIGIGVASGLAMAHKETPAAAVMIPQEPKPLASVVVAVPVVNPVVAAAPPEVVSVTLAPSVSVVAPVVAAKPKPRASAAPAPSAAPARPAAPTDSSGFIRVRE